MHIKCNVLHARMQNKHKCTGNVLLCLNLAKYMFLYTLTALKPSFTTVGYSLND